MDDLTKDQKFVLTSMYKHYLELQPGLSSKKATYMGNSDEVRDLFAPQFTYSYTSEICWKLKSKEYILCEPGDNKANEITIADKTIIYMENRFKNVVVDVLSFIKTLR